jgi:hypothetical protein
MGMDVKTIAAIGMGGAGQAIAKTPVMAAG